MADVLPSAVRPPASRWTCRSAGRSGNPHQERPRGLAQQHFAAAHFPPPLSVLSAGQRLTLLAFTLHLSASPGSSGRCPGSPLWPRPCCSSGLALGSSCSLVTGTSPLAGRATRHFPCRGTLPSLCRVLCPLCPSSVSCVPTACPCPMSLQHVPCPHSMPSVPASRHVAGMSAHSLGCGLGAQPLQACPRWP